MAICRDRHRSVAEKSGAFRDIGALQNNVTGRK